MNFEITAIGEILFDVYPEYKKLGGAPFNFIYHIKKLIGKGNFISRIGNDEEGKKILKFLEKREFNARYIQIDETHATGEVDINLDEKKVPDFEIIKNRAYDYIKMKDELTSLVENSNLFYVGSLAQREELSRTTVQALAKRAKKVFCDLNIRQKFYTKEIIQSTLEKSNVVKLNSDELKLVNNLILKKKYEIQSTAKTLLKRFDLDLLCVTIGSDGAYLFSNKEVSHHKAIAEDIIDTVGAGDAFAALMSIGYLNNWEIEKTNRLASEFAAEICKVRGAIPGDEKIYNEFKTKMKNE